MVFFAFCDLGAILGLASAFGLLAVSAFLELWTVKLKVPSVRLRDDQIGLMPESMILHP